MSDLYLTPAERAKQLRDSTRTGNWFQDTFTDIVTPGITKKEDGSISREGAAWWLQGLTPGADSIADQKQELDESRVIHREVQNSQLTPAQIKAASGGQKLTSGNVGGIIAEGQRTVTDRLSPAERAQISYQKDSLGATIASTNSTNERLLQQGAQSHQLALIQAADARDASAQSLALQQQQLIREDQRYNERMEQLDRRDRKQGRQSLIAGLAALGAAFAL
jgi:hypothetical protein